jgi:aminoglycoside phosphotransferase
MDAAQRYLADHVDVPSSRLERLRHALLPFTARTTAPPSDSLTELVFTTITHEPRLARTHLRSIVRSGVDQDGRRRVLAFLFDGEARLPFAIVKAQENLVNGSLRTEAESLERVRPRLPETLRTTLPEVLALHTDERGEVLAISGLPGRSAWFDLRTSLLPSRHTGRHLRAAAQWLAAFHEATRVDDDTAAAHGDFWPGNLLLDGPQLGGLVDWEHYRPIASRYIDLFHFPLTYGINFPWKRYRFAHPERAFAATFLETNPVSRAVRTYLHEYATRTALPLSRLDEAFHQFLATHGTMTPDQAPHPGTRGLPWDRFAALLARPLSSSM